MNMPTMVSPKTDPEVMPRVSHREGPVARTIEQATANLPSDMFLWAGLAALGASMFMGFRKPTHGESNSGIATAVGLLAPTFLILGLYNKLVKLEGSDGA